MIFTAIGQQLQFTPGFPLLHLNILSAYCLCGASAFVAAGMLLLAQVDDPQLARAVKVLVGGFFVVAVALFPVGFAVDDGGMRNSLILLATIGTLSGSALFGSGFSLLAGDRPPRIAAWLTAVAVGFDCVAWVQSPAVFEFVFNALATLISIAITIPQWRIVRGGGTRAEKAVASGLALYATVWMIRFYFTATTDGSRSFHASHVPLVLEPWMGVFFGTIPVIIAALGLNVINERLILRLRTLAHTDELTGALSRRALIETGPQLLERELDRGHKVAMLMIDIDKFKHVNDRYGHAAGDAVIKRTAQLLSQQLRSDSVVARYGGEEFVILLPAASQQDAYTVAERLRKTFEKEICCFKEMRIGITISIGLAMLTEQEQLDEAIARADAALYRAKASGRNCVDIAFAT